MGIAVNFVGGFIINLLKLPIYLDALGSMVIGALCGPIYGIITAVATGLLLAITHPTNLYYLGNYFFVGFLSGLFGSMGYFTKWWKSVIYGLIIGVVCGVAGSLVTVAVFGVTKRNWPHNRILHKTFALPIPTANMISEVSTDILDKIPTALVAFLIVNSISNRFLIKLPLGNLYIKKKPEVN